MTNYYLERLGVQPGANASEIKAAYRRLAKKYHPDMNKSPEAQRRFIEIHEAYKFLTDVGPAPNREAVNYDFNPAETIYDVWRAQAKAYAQQKAREAQREQRRILQKIYVYFNYAAFLIVLFNLFLLVDYFLPEERSKKDVIAIYRVIEKNKSNQMVYQYDDVQFDGFRFRIKKEQSIDLKEVKRSEIVFTPLLKTLKHAEFELENSMLKINPAYSIYAILVYLSPLTLIFCIFYFTIPTHSDSKLTLLIVILFALALGSYIFIRFSIINQTLNNTALEPI